MKTPAIIATALLAAAFVSNTHTAPSAEARILCVYKAEDTSRRVVTGSGEARKGSTACTRARRECKRRLKSAVRKRKFGRTYGCRKVASERV